MRRITLAVAGTALLFRAALSPAAEPSRPSVIIVLSDDQGYGDFSCHGNPVLKTPNLDRLHAESIRFTDFHVAPMCTPTRGQLLTGLDALRNGATYVSAGRTALRRGIPTVAEVFKAGGYRTAMFGKWHLGDSYPNRPHDRGFEEAVYHLGWGITSIADLWQNDYFDGRFRHNGVLKQYQGYCTDLWFDLAIAWLKERRTKREPFFLYLPTNAAHGPLWGPERYRQPYEGRGPARFFGMLANLDENVGRLESFLEDSDLRENTILIYMNDNGGTAGVRVFNAGLRAQKTQYYDGGHRAACFVRWPAGKLRPPGDVGVLTQVQDLFPTLADLCGLKTPAGGKLDGLSLAGLLRGTQEALPDRMLVVQYGPRPEKWESAVLWRKWRLVKGAELYDLEADPGQQRDVARNHPDLLARLRAHYEAWWTEVGPLVDDLSPLSVGSDHENPVTLTAADWAYVYCDNSSHLREGIGRNGPWQLLVEKDGEYEVTLRRWPREADAPIAGGVPAWKAQDGELPPGKALPIARARLKVAGLDESKAVGPEDRAATFTVALRAGDKLAMQSWFYDAEGKELCGAYYAYVRRR